MNPTEALIEKLHGMTIEGGEVLEDGLHLNLNNGYILIFVGAFGVGLLAPESRNYH